MIKLQKKGGLRMNFIFLAFLAVLSLVYMFINLAKKNKGMFIFSLVCSIFFIFMTVMIYLVDYAGI